MKDIYDWVPWFTTLARKIADGGPRFLVDRAKQVNWRDDGRVQPLLNYGDNCIDPFSFFYTLATWSRSAQSRKRVFLSISEVFGQSALADYESHDKFVYPQPVQSVLFHNRGETNPKHLWKLFRQAVSGLADIGSGDFRNALNLDQVAPRKLTHVLFLVNPHEFLPYDAFVRYLGQPEQPARDFVWEDYRLCLDRLRGLFPGCLPYEINVLEYLAPNLRCDRVFHVSSNVYGDGRDHWGDFKSNNWVYTGGPKSGTRWQDYDGGELNGGYPLSEPRLGEVVLVRRGVTRGRGIGVVYRNDFENNLSEQSKLHVIWVNKNTHQLTGQTARLGFSRAKGKTLEAFQSTDTYAATFELLRNLEKRAATPPRGAQGEVRDGDLTGQENMGSVEHPRNRILYGPPGTGKTYDTVRHALAIVDRVEMHEAKHDTHRFRELRFDPEAGSGQIAMITFHQNFAYEDFVEGIRPVLEVDDLRYERRDGIFKCIALAAEKEARVAEDEQREHKLFVLIIDEINRGNIAKIFGELITLLEDSRRIGQKDETKVTLPYSGEDFGVPDNLYVIGTMNTADRSIQLLDTALRRRFAFIEMMPNSEHDLVPGDVAGVNCQELLKAMNGRITALLDREHQIGHTYFRGIDNIDKLSEAFRQKIFPLLQEYFFDDWAKIRTVLADNGFVHAQTGDKYLPEHDILDGENKIYERLADGDDGWNDPAKYREIYASRESGEQENN